MTKRNAEIIITGNTDDAKASIKDLENLARKSFNKMAEDAKKESKEVSDAFQKSGLRMEKDIKKSTEGARARYKKINNSGTASANDIKRAHTAMTKKIKANNRELKTSNGLVSKGFKFMKSNILALSIGVAAMAVSIKKAFDFTETAAKLKAQKLAFKNYTESLGVDSEDLLKKLKEVSRGTVAESDLIGSAGKALLLQLDPTKIVKLLEIARASSKITGESLTQLFEDVAKGTGRASRLILDNLGIQFKQGEATRRVSILLQKKAEDLTGAEIAQGNLNEVIRQGQPIIERVGKDYTSQADVLAQIKARYTDMVVIIGQKFLKMMPKVELWALKISKRFLENIKVISKVTRAFNVLTDFLHITTNATEGADHGIDNLTRGMDFLDKKIKDSTKVMDELVAAEKKSVETSKMIIEEAKKRMKLREDEESLIIDNLAIQVKSINAAGEAQKAQNSLLKKSISETKKELRGLEAEVKKSASFTQQILDEIAGGVKRREQVQFDPLEKLVDDLERAEEDLKTAVKERAAGDVDRARELALSAIQAANALLDAKEDADLDSKITAGGLRDATREAEKLVKKVKLFAEEMGKAAVSAVPAVTEKLASMESQLEAGKQTVKGITEEIKAAQAAAEKLKATLGQDTSSTNTINTVYTTSGSNNGGQGFNTGGPIGGYGGGDTIPIMVEGGEHVIKKESVKKLGRRAANAFNAGDIKGLIDALPVQHFNQGGEVQAEGTTNVNMIMGDKSYPMTAKQSVADEFVEQIGIVNIVRGRKKNRY